MHHCLAECAGTYAISLVNLLFDEALFAIRHPRWEVEILLLKLVILAHLELLLRGLEILEAWTAKRVHRHFSLSCAHAAT